MLIFICDDEEFYLNQVHSLLKEYFCENELNDVSYKLFNSGKELLDCGIVPDIAFLDVELDNNLSGTKIGKYLKEKNPYVKIFIVTAHVGYIDEAFRFSFFRFLTKPINKLNLFRNLKDAIYQNSTELINVDIETKNGIQKVNAMDIIAIKVDKRGTDIYLKEEIISSKNSISYFENLLADSSFFRTHREFIVNMRYVLEFDKNSINLSYKGSVTFTAYLSRLKHKSFKDKYLWYKERML
ncbi:MAG: LytTR family DNA-binding domain-containing protein [Clostridia bacterium]